MEENPAVEDGEHSKDVAPALIAVHPLHKSVAVAVGSDLRVFDLQGNCSVSLVDDSGGPLHKDSIRAICFGAKGRLFASAGDDKLVKIWSSDSWHCIRTVSTEKRVTAVAISINGLYVCYADKFGVVWAMDLGGSNENGIDKATPIFSHYCSIITSLEFSPDGQFIVSADRDYKIRATVFPSNPLDGVHEIQSFCLGHSEFVSCLAFICPADYPKGYLISGGGDSTVRLWDVTSGSLFDTCNVGAEARTLQSNGTEEWFPAVTDICATPDSTVVAVAIQSFRGIMLLNCNVSAKTLSVIKVASVTGETIPTSLGASPHKDLLWLITGVSNLHGPDSFSLVRLRVISGFKKSVQENVPSLLGDDEIPGGGKLLQALQGSEHIEDQAFLAASEAVKMGMHNLLTKKQYTAEKREFRKKGRNDRKGLQ